MAYNNEVLALSPSAYWRLGESSGTNATDETGNYDGTYTNSPTLGATGLLEGDSDTAITTNGTNYVDCGDILSFERTDEFSLTFSFDGVVSSTEQPILGKTSTGSQGILVSVDNGDLTVYIMGSWPTNTIDVRVPVVFEGLNHVVVTYDGSSTAAGVIVYINGVEQTPNVLNDTLSTTTINSASWKIGSSYGAGVACTIDEVAIFSKTLTSEEVNSIYTGFLNLDTSTYSGLVRSTSPTLYWRMEETSGITVADEGNTGNLSGTVFGGIVGNSVTGQVGNAITRTNSQYIRKSDEADFDTQELTLAGWFKIDSSSSGTAGFLVHHGGTNYNWGLYQNSADALEFYVRIGSVQAATISSANWNFDEWIFLVGTYDGSNLKIYLNGVLEDTTAASGTVSTNGGSFSVGQGDNWDGVVLADYDEVAFWTRALDLPTIKALYDAAWLVDTSSPVDFFTTLGSVTYRFWNQYETLASTLPTDQVAELNFESDLTTATVGPNWIKRGLDNISRNNVSGVDGYYATLEGDLSQASCLALDTSSLSIPTNASISLWFYVPDGLSEDGYSLSASLFANKEDTSGSFRRIEHNPDGTLKLITQDSVEGQVSLTFPTTVTEGEWHHVTYVCDGLTQKLFLDGVKEEITLNNSAPIYDAYASIFGRYNGDSDTTTGAFHGRIDNVKIFDRILTDKEVLALSNEFTP